jgi:hypothetical protein
MFKNLIILRLDIFYIISSENDGFSTTILQFILPFLKRNFFVCNEILIGIGLKFLSN